MMQKPMTRAAALALSVLTALALSACAAPPDQHAPALTPETVEAEPAASQVQSQAAIQVPAIPKITSQDLLGQGGPWVKLKLGEPAFVRTEKAANIWQYKNSKCVLNVFLYEQDAVTEQPRVLHFDARDVHGGNTDRDACLAILQN